MIAMTTSNSISVKPDLFINLLLFFCISPEFPPSAHKDSRASMTRWTDTPKMARL